MICLSQSDTALIARCQRDDLAAFDEIVARYKQKIFNYIFRMVGSSEEAEDLTQEVFVKMYLALESFRSQASLSTWLYRIAGNLCIDAHRKKARRETGFGGGLLSLDEPASYDGARGEDSAPREVPDATHEPFRLVARQEMDTKIQDALALLPGKMRMVVILHDVEGLQYDEIAQVVGCPLGTVKSRLFNARMHLRELLSPYLES